MTIAHNPTPLLANGHHDIQHGRKKPLSYVDGFGTRAIHVGSEPDPSTGAVIPPISLSTTYKQDSVGNHKVCLRRLHSVSADRDADTLAYQGFEYSRSGNPNRDALETSLASLESGGAIAIAFSSGSATTATIVQAIGPNAHVLSVNDVYGGTFRYFKRVASETQGLQSTFMDLSADDDTILASIRDNTKVSLFGNLLSFLGDSNFSQFNSSFG